MIRSHVMSVPRIVLALAGISALSCAPARGDDSSPVYQRRLFYVQMNLQVAENADRLVDLIGRAEEAGYNGFVLADYKLNVLDRVPEHYFTNVARVKAAARAAGIEIIPAVFPIGYSAGLLAHDPNLAEGLPVVAAPFVVQGHEAVLDPQSAPQLENGDFENADGDRFAGFRYQDDVGVATHADRAVRHGGTTSLRIQGLSLGGNRRVIQPVAVRPFACYRLSAWVKTQNVADPGSFRLLAIGAGKDARPLTFLEGGVKPTQDWARLDVVFNSLDNDAVNLYAGTWGDRSRRRSGSTTWQSRNSRWSTSCAATAVRWSSRRRTVRQSTRRDATSSRWSTRSWVRCPTPASTISTMTALRCG